MRPTLRLAALLLLLLAASPALAEGDFLAAMEREHAADRPVAGFAAAAEPAAAVETRRVDYADLEGEAVTGFLALPPGDGPWPGVIVIHEWWGLNDNIRTMARRLAEEGYAALAVDLYEGEVAEEPEAAGRLARAAGDRRERVTENLRQAAGYLAEAVGAERIGVVGWCFGGGWSLATALALPEAIDAAVIYYGRLVTDRDELASLEAPILGHFGSEDRGIPVESAREFEGALEELGKPAEIHVYEGADHAFANPSGTRYEPEAAEAAWKRTLEFFARHLR